MKGRARVGWWGVAVGSAVVVALGVAAVQAQAVRPQARAAKPHETKAQPPAASKPLAGAEHKAVEELQAELKQFDMDAAHVIAGSVGGRRRVAETIARQFGVPEKVVNELRARRMGYGEVTVALALSQQLMKRERGVSQAQAIERVVALRKSGLGWGVVARDLGLKLGDVVSEVKKTDRQLAKLETVKLARTEKAARPEKLEKPARPEKMDKPGKSEKLTR